VKCGPGDKKNASTEQEFKQDTTERTHGTKSQEKLFVVDAESDCRHTSEYRSLSQQTKTNKNEKNWIV